MDMVENLKKLADELERDDLEKAPPPTSSAIDIRTLSEYDILFTDEAKAAMSKKFNKVVGPVTPEYKTAFLSLTVRGEANIPAAAKTIADEVNFLASMGKVLGILSPLSKLRLAKTWSLNGEYIGFQDVEGGNHIGLAGNLEAPEGAVLDADRWVVFCFVTVPWEFEPEFYQEATDLRLYHKEGEIGEEFCPDPAETPQT
jgi:hypothetical protein